MQKKLTFEFQRDGKWLLGSCPEVPGASGQGRTLMSCSRNLVQAVAMILDEEDDPRSTRTTVEVEVLGKSVPYSVELLESWEGFAVRCPDLPGCFSQGDDEEEALDNIRNAIKDYVEVAEEIRQEPNRQLEKVA